MSTEARRVLEAALKLSDDERVELGAILADSVGDSLSEAEIDAAWVAEALRRLEGVRSGKSKTSSAQEVVRELEERITARESKLVAG